jgi:hypothetical protein
VRKVAEVAGGIFAFDLPTLDSTVL